MRPRQVPANPDVQDKNGRTPLYLACLRGHERAVRALLKAGACPDVLDKRGKPAQVGAFASAFFGGAMFGWMNRSLFSVRS